jgi:hypothetical protein
MAMARYMRIMGIYTKGSFIKIYNIIKECTTIVLIIRLYSLYLIMVYKCNVGI